MPSSKSRSISITCRGIYQSSIILVYPANAALGKSIGRDELYRYTNGRFLVDEKNQCERRYVKFDLDRLCEIAASVGDSKCPIKCNREDGGRFQQGSPND